MKEDRMRATVTSILDVIALICIVIGVSMWSPPAGWVCLGVGVLALSVIHAPRERVVKREPPS